MKYMVKIDRIAAWVLLIGILFYFISGYGMTKGIIDANFATKLHLNYLPFVVVLAFIIHTGFAIHLAFRRWKMWNSWSMALLVFVYLFFFAAFVYIGYFYQKPVVATISVSNSNSIPAQTATPSGNATTVKTFTTAELATFDGRNGQRAYLAVDGQVYDLSTVFIGGTHFGHPAGVDLSNAFYSRHVKSALSKYPIVGILQS
jgi:predicted heme/steroid binding protein